ncbi:hypothetical protein IAR55_001760 [Kwoniella newhampshirensis]|uniref:JmjC domain-containing protein n=1 Tax=Kwoniella newhampshirensis TaxID=1651941 RepID=A0AAW0Z340_9TREE
MSTPTLAPIIRSAKSVCSLSPSALRTHLIAGPSRATPLHLPDLISDWPALKTWSLSDHMKAVRDGVGENKSVEVELGKKGRGYLHKEWQRVWMPFGLFLDAFILNLVPSSSPSEELPTAYLAQSDILDSSPNLLEAIPVLPHFYEGKEKSLYRRTMWIGPKGSFTPFHKDPYHGIYSQIVGKKTFHILPPGAVPHLDISSLPRHTNTSQIPLPVSRIYSSPSSPTSTTSTSPPVGPTTSTSNTLDDLSDLPHAIVQTWRTKLDAAFDMPGACQVTLEAGESVLVPEGWWHAAEGVDGSGVGVNAWFR